MRPTGIWMPMYWADYFADTLHLTTTEHGAYLLLLGTYWRRGEALPDDDRFLAQTTRCGAKRWKTMRVVLSKYFILEDGVWKHKRLEYEILRSNARSTAAQRAGNASATARQQVTVTVTNTKKIKKDSQPSADVIDDWPSGYLDEFWNKYPPGRKTSKQAVILKLAKIRKSGDITFNRLMAGLQRYIDSHPEPQFTKAPMVWLNGGGWDDEYAINGNGRTPTLRERTANALQQLGGGPVREALDFGLPKLDHH